MSATRRGGGKRSRPGSRISAIRPSTRRSRTVAARFSPTRRRSATNCGRLSKPRGGSVQVISSEYAYFGRNPSAADDRGGQSGRVRLRGEVARRTGHRRHGNGGPGYWPAGESEGEAGGRDRREHGALLLTHPNLNITSTIRSWKIDSKLTPEWSERPREAQLRPHRSELLADHSRRQQPRQRQYVDDRV